MTEEIKKELRPVSLKEVHNWLMENKHHTWFNGKGGPFSQEGRDKGGSMMFKYLYLSLDTRTMEIFHIGSNAKSADFKEAINGGENILDLLTYHTRDKSASPAAPEGSLERKLQSKFPDLDYMQVVEALKYIKDDCVDVLFSKGSADSQGSFDWHKKQYTYHAMREEFDKIVGAL